MQTAMSDAIAVKKIASALLLNGFDGLPIPVLQALAMCVHKKIPVGVLEQHYDALLACLTAGLCPAAWRTPVIRAALQMTGVACEPDDLGVSSQALKRCLARVFDLASQMRQTGRMARSWMVQDLLRRALPLLPAYDGGDSSSDADSSSSEPSPSTTTCSESTTLPIPKGCQILFLPLNGTVADADAGAVSDDDAVSAAHPDACDLCIEACNVCACLCCLIAADITLKSE